MKKLLKVGFVVAVAAVALAFTGGSDDSGDSDTQGSPTNPPDSHTHSYSTDWKSDETNHWKECSCGAKSEEEAHTEYSGTVTKEATETETGEKTYKCKVCQEKLRTVAIRIAKTSDVASIISGIPAGETRFVKVMGTITADTIASIKTALTGLTGNQKVELDLSEVENLDSLANQAFNLCTSLVSIKIPSSVTSIGGSAFQGCSGLTSVEIPSSVTSIGSYAFYNCSKLANVTVNAETPPTLGMSAFGNNASGRKIYVPKGTGDAYKAADGWKDFKNDIVELPE